MIVRSMSQQVSPKFGSASGFNGLWFANLMQQADAYNKQQAALKNQNNLPVSIMKPVPDAFRAQQATNFRNNVRFGEGLTLVAWAAAHPFLTWLSGAAGTTAMDSGIKAMVSDMNSHQGIGLDSSQKFKLAKSRLQHAEKQNNLAVKKEYLLKAEHLFVDAAGEAPESYKKSEYYKYATITAEMAGRSPQTVLDYANIALEHRRDAWAEIDAIKRELAADKEKQIPLMVRMPIVMATGFITGVATLWSSERVLDKAVDATNNALINLSGEMPEHIRDAKEKIVTEFGHPNDCYKVCTEIKSQAEQALSRTMVREKRSILRWFNVTGG